MKIVFKSNYGWDDGQVGHPIQEFERGWPLTSISLCTPQMNTYVSNNVQWKRFSTNNIRMSLSSTCRHLSSLNRNQHVCDKRHHYSLFTFNRAFIHQSRHGRHNVPWHPHRHGWWDGPLRARADVRGRRSPSSGDHDNSGRDHQPHRQAVFYAKLILQLRVMAIWCEYSILNDMG